MEMGDSVMASWVWGRRGTVGLRDTPKNRLYTRIVGIYHLPLSMVKMALQQNFIKTGWLVAGHFEKSK